MTVVDMFVRDTSVKTRATTAEQKAWAIAATVCDPEIPVLTIEDLKVNAPLKPEQFALAQPPGAQVVNLDMQSAAALRASDGNSSKPDNKQKPKSQMD